MTAPDLEALIKTLGWPAAIFVAGFILAVKYDLLKFDRGHSRSDILNAIEKSSQEHKAEARAIRERQDRMQGEVTDRLARLEERINSQGRQLDRIDNRRRE